MNNKIMIIFIIIVLFSGAYWLMSSQRSNEGAPAVTNQSPIVSDGNPQPGNPTYDLPVEPAVVVARKDLATKLSIDEKSIVILNITEKTWSDGCLGLGGPAESCLQSIVPGFRIEMLASEKIYFYRTNKTGVVIRMETE